jgi:hypothetical protein
MNRSTKTEIKKKAIISLDYIHYNNENNYYISEITFVNRLHLHYYY